MYVAGLLSQVIPSFPHPYRDHQSILSQILLIDVSQHDLIGLKKEGDYDL